MNSSKFRWLLVLIAVISCGATVLLERTISKRENLDLNLAPGQVWIYKTRSHETASRLTILKIEQHAKLGEIVHIALNGLKLKNSDTTVAHHLPCSGSFLRDSLVRIDRANVVLPEYQEGYDLWKAAFDQGKAGAFKAPVSDIVQMLENNVAKASAHP